MRILHTVPDLEKQAAGPTYSVVRLCESLLELGEDVALAMVGNQREAHFMHAFEPGWGPRKLGASPAMKRWLTQQVHGGADIVHNHSLWMMPNVYPGWATRGTSTRYVVSPRGTLSEWAMKNGSKVKRIFWPLLQKPSLEHACCFHATSAAEYEDIRRMGFRQPVAVIPNGIDVPALPDAKAEPARTVLYLGRLHPVKGVDLLLHAWKRLQFRFPQWNLRVVGPLDNPTAASLVELANTLGLQQVRFEGALYGDAKLSAYLQAALYVLPSHSENFAMTVAEALSCATPVIVSQGAPWGEVERVGAGWWPPTGFEGLLSALASAMEKPPAVLSEMGENGRRWMQQCFSWQSIGADMQSTYRWLRKVGPMPSCVQLA